MEYAQGRGGRRSRLIPLRIVGVDPSSSVCGVALVEDGRLLRTDAWKRPKRGSAPERLLDCYLWMVAWILVYRPDMAVIEFLSVERNAKTTRVVSHYQAACTLACKATGLIVIEARVSSARAAALGNGSLSKEDAFKLIREMFPDHDFGRDDARFDRADATVLGVAGPRVAERA